MNRSSNRLLLALILLVVAPYAFAGEAVDWASGKRITRRPEVLAERNREVAARRGDGRSILMIGGAFDPLTEAPSFDSTLDLRVPRFGKNDIGVYLLQVTAGGSVDLASEGFHSLRRIPENALIVSGPEANLDRLRRQRGVRFVGSVHPGLKLSPDLIADDFAGQFFLDVVVLPGADSARILGAGSAATLVGRADFEGGSRLRFRVAGSELRTVAAALANEPWVESVQLWTLPEVRNDHSIYIIQDYDTANGTNYALSAKLWNQGLIGTGQVVCVNDSGLDADMCFFKYTAAGYAAAQTPTPPATGTLDGTKKVIGYAVLPGAAAYDTSGASYHGTHVAGSVLGDNLSTLSTPTANGHNTADGMAPQAKLYMQDVGDAGGSLAGLSGDLYQISLQARNAGAFAQSDSWGAQQASGPMPYTSDAFAMDSFTWDYEEFLHVVAQGNTDGGPYVGSPAIAKNIVSVGAATHGSAGSTGMASFSVIGPTVDGRIKPDIDAPGSSIISAQGNATYGDGNCSTQPMSGTSMATPTASGGLALARQYFTDGFYPTGAKVAANSRVPSAALLKAVLIAGADDMGTQNVPTDTREGWGRMHLDNALFFTSDASRVRVWDRRNAVGLLTGQEDTVTLQVGASRPFRVALVWSDPPSSTAASTNLVNNLDLEVVGPGGTFKGNVFSSGASQTGGTADAINNVEQVILKTPTAGTYTVKVKGTSVLGNGFTPSSDRQGYALVAVFQDCGSAPGTPSGMLATDAGAAGIALSWNAVAGALRYEVYRAGGSCSSPSSAFAYLGTTTATSLSDTAVQGGYTYAYQVRAANDCQVGPASACDDATSTGNCTLDPTFAGLTSAVNDLGTAACDVLLSWSAATSNCPLGATVRYNVYRGLSPYFTIGAASRIATGVVATSYRDSAVEPQKTYFYVVRAEDGTSANGGPANGGNETGHQTLKMATPWGSTNIAGTFTDDGGDTNAKLSLAGPWRVTNVQNHTGGGSFAYANAADGSPYPAGTCAAATTPPLVLQAGSPQLTYWARYNLEYQWDGVVVEVSTNGGGSWVDVPPTGGYPGDFSTGGGVTSPINACGYALTQGGINGPNGNAALTAWTQFTHSLASFAGQTALIRWNFSSDGGAEFQGFFLDDVAVTLASRPGDCTIRNGIVTLDANTYACADTIGVRLIDSDLQGAGAHVVGVQSTTEPTFENVSLTETPANSGTFLGSIASTAAAPVNGNGLISLANGDTITARYVDADDGQGGFGVTKTDTAIADCAAPIISNVAVSGIGTSAATITWTTNEPATSVVIWDTALPPVANTATDSALVASHSIPLTGLVTCTTYRFEVRSADDAGNLASATNGGAYYSFTTLGQQHILGPDDVESGVGSWSATGEWAIRTCQAASPTRAWKAGASTCPGTYAASTNSYLTTANLDFGSGGYHLYWNERYDLESEATCSYDHAQIQISTNGGANWSDVGSKRCGSSAGWQARDYDLSSYTGTARVRFWMKTDGIVAAEGWYVDDIRISRAAACAPALEVASRTAVDDCIVGGAGDGNGIVDPGETAAVAVTALNSGIMAASGVSGVLSTTTPGVSILDASATWPNLASGASAASQAPHFLVGVGTGVPCGTVIAFDVAFSSAEGTWNDNFTLDVGSTSPSTFTALSENFASGIPGTWSVVNGGSGSGAAATWTTANPGARTPVAPMATPFVIVDSDAAAASDTQDEELITPAMNLSVATSVTLAFHHYFRRFQSEIADVDVSSSLTSGSWVNVRRYTGSDTANPATESVSLTTWAAGATNVRVRFRYYNASDEWYWMVDNVTVTYQAPASCSSTTCNSGAAVPAPPVGGDGVRFAKGGVPNQIAFSDLADDGCSSDHAVVLWGSFGSFTGYSGAVTGCNIGTADAGNFTLTQSSAWFNVLWVNSSSAGGHPGFAYPVASRTWTATGFCGVVSDDASDSTCN